MTMVWRKTIDRWNRMNRSRKREVDGRRAPSRNDEYLFYQTLIGCWPLEELDAAASTAFRERIQAYMIKAAREAKLRTSWANINTEYWYRSNCLLYECLGRAFRGGVRIKY